MLNRRFIASAGLCAALACSIPSSVAAQGMRMPMMGAEMDMSMGRDPSGPARRVRITYTNLTSGQDFSPSLFITTARGAPPLFEPGQPASFGLMRLAEEGALGGLFDGAAMMGPKFGTAAAAIPAMPGQSRTVDLDVTRDHPMLSGVWMLAKTNDGFTGVNAVDAYDLKRPVSMDLMAWDAGTERNNEKKAYLIAMMGAERDPENGVVHRHTGIRGDADAPASWKFDPSQPVARITITPLGPSPMAMPQK